MDITIIGGGIAGLTTALMLHRAGLECRVFESVTELKELGVGINLLPHAVRELTALDLQDDLADVAIQTAELCYFNRFGQRIWQEDRGIAAGYDWPQFSIHRGEFHGILRAAVETRLGADRLRCGHSFSDYRIQDDGRVELTFVDRRTGAEVARHVTDCVIAADGIHSRMRALFYPDEGMPLWNGAVLWRGVTEAAPFLSGRSMFMAGHQDQKFVAYPISAPHEARGRSLVNWIAELRFPPAALPEREDWNKPGRLEDFLPQFESWDFDWIDIPALIRGADSVLEFPMVDRDPVETWVRGPAALLGDAAHPMYPIGSNGASQAILDARAIATALCDHADIPAALQAYDAARRPGVSRIVLANRGNGPEQVMQLAQERAPDGFTDIDSVIPRAELQAIADRYKQIAGFDKRSLATDRSSRT